MLHAHQGASRHCTYCKGRLELRAAVPVGMRAKAIHQPNCKTYMWSIRVCVCCAGRAVFSFIFPARSVLRYYPLLNPPHGTPRARETSSASACAQGVQGGTRPALRLAPDEHCSCRAFFSARSQERRRAWLGRKLAAPAGPPSYRDPPELCTSGTKQSLSIGFVGRCAPYAGMCHMGVHVREMPYAGARPSRIAP